MEKRVFHTFGLPEFIHSDNGRQFEDTTFQEFIRTYGTTHIKSAFYSPQANASERVNRSVLQIVRSYVGDNQRHWGEHISEVEWALRSACHSAIKMEPYYALFGNHMIQHANTYKLLRKLDNIKDIDLCLDSPSQKQQLLRNKICENLTKAYEKGAKVYNTRCKDVKFVEGQIVYRRNNKQSNQVEGYNAKLGPRHIKCIVGKSIGNSLYEILGLDGKRIGIYHAKDLFAL